MIWPRVLTAAILIPLVFAAIFWLPPVLFQLVAILLFCGLAWEWGQLCETKLTGFAKYYVVVFVLGMLGLHWIPLDLSRMLLWGILVIWLGLLVTMALYKGHPPWLLQSPIRRALIGLLVLWGACLSLLLIRFHSEGAKWLLGLCLIVWTCDTAAYFAGRFFGKRLFSPLISPKKTWAGFWGGLLIAWSVGMGYVIWMGGSAFSSWKTPLSLLVLILLSIYGDLFESLIKRIAQKKDSGQLLPGHGGLLDRMDSLLPTLPWFASTLTWIGPLAG